MRKQNQTETETQTRQLFGLVWWRATVVVRISRLCMRNWIEQQANTRRYIQSRRRKDSAKCSKHWQWCAASATAVEAGTGLQTGLAIVFPFLSPLFCKVYRRLANEKTSPTID